MRYPAKAWLRHGHKLHFAKNPVRFLCPLRSARRYTFPVGFLLWSALVFCAPRLVSQDWNFVKGIKVGDLAERAVSLPDRNEIVVANRGSCNLSVISTLTNEVITTIELGKTPERLATDHDGYVYVLAQDRLAPPCELPGSDGGNYSIGIVNTHNNSVESWTSLPGWRWEDLALTGDGRLFMTLVTPFNISGVYVFDTAQRTFLPYPVIPAREGCAVNLALAEHQNEIFVAYQCGSRPGHDPVAIYCLTAKDSCRSAYDQIASISGFPNVGGMMSISPDENYLWEYGIDACSQPAYDHKGCPGNDPAKGTDEPTKILNLIDTDSLVVRTYPFRLTDDSGFVSFSPELEAYIGGQAGIKVLKKPGIGSPEKLNPPIPDGDPCHSLNAVGQINFARVGDVEYMYAVVGSADSVCVLKRPAPPAIAPTGPLAQPAKVGKKYAIVIGIQSFMYGWTPLYYSASDAANLATALTKYYGYTVTNLPGTPGCKNSQCYVTKKQIVDAFESLLYDSPGKKRDFTSQDQLFVYISGHGDQFADPDLSSHHFLVTSDSTVKESDHESAATELDFLDIWNLLQSSNLRHVLFVVDACYAGLNSPAAFGGPTFQVALQDGKPFVRARPLADALQRNVGFTRKYLSASPFATEKVPDHSIFAEKLVQALDSMRTTPAGYFTFESMLTQIVNLEPQPRPSSYSPDDTAHGDFIFIPDVMNAAN
jgi:YVTN family beta-propeller protein